MGRKYVANAFHNRSLIDSNKGGGGGGGAAEEYVAEETKIGTFLGKDLYRQVITATGLTLPANIAETPLSLGETGINPRTATVIKFDGTMRFNELGNVNGFAYVNLSPVTANYSSATYFGNQYNAPLVYLTSNGDIKVKGTGNYGTTRGGTVDFVVIVEYTKD